MRAAIVYKLGPHISEYASSFFSLPAVEGDIDFTK